MTDDLHHRAADFRLSVLAFIIRECHVIAKSKGFWEGKDYRSAGPEKIALMHSELSEALEAMREARWNGDVGDHSVCEELADLCIRVFDYCAAQRMDLAGMILKKMEKNRKRPYMHGKRF